MRPVNARLTVERWARIEDVFHQAREERHRPRDETLRRLCGDDEELLAGVRALLLADEEANRPRAAKPIPKADLAGRRAGNYQLDSLLGTGGMGSVYLAHRCDGQFDRQAALKILGANLRSEFFTERFAVERQLLASLDHPHITRLLDSGVSSEGDPYLVLEYVDGRPLDEYCDQRRLGVNERIRLFLQACAAVEFAHSKRVLHRDLKPSNILTAADGTVKLLDFGTAKLLETAGESNATATRFRMMTPRYASPEQLRGDTLTPATDVYSLGVILYELLTGAWPYGDPQSVVCGLERAVRDVEPRHPKAVIDDEAATRRALSRTALIGMLSGDLWKVILKAIQPEPERRYVSVEDFARDLERYLAGKPVQARPQTLAYRAGRFVRRNRAGVAFALAAMAAGAGLYFWPGRARPAPGATSVVVLPFKNLSADPGNRYFSDGLTDEITDALSQLKALRVIARDSAFELRDQAGNIREVGRKLNVTNVLEGSVERYGNRVKIVARLQRVSDGSQIWSHTYERQTSDLFSVQSELAASIADNLKTSVEVRNPNKHVVRDQEAIDAYMRATYEMDQFTPESMKKAVADLQYAIERDPEYAAAYASLGVAENNGSHLVALQKQLSAAEVVQTASRYYRKAIELDPDLISPRVNLAQYALQFDWDWGGAEREYKIALTKGPNAAAHQNYALLLLCLGRIEEADEHLRLAREENPYATVGIRFAATARLLEGRYAQAQELAEQLLARSPGSVLVRAFIRNPALALGGRPDLALADYQKLEARLPQAKAYEAYVLACAGGRQDEALRLIRPFEERYQTGVIPMAGFAAFYACLGDEANTVKWLERSADAHEWAVLSIGVDPMYSRVRSGPEFQAVMKRIGLKH
jgi:TolB-like protein